MDRGTPSPELSARRFLFVLLLATLAALGVILFELGPALVLAGVLAVLMAPLQNRLVRLKPLRKRPNIAAGVLVFLVTLFVLTPTVWLSAVIVQEVSGGVGFVARTLRSDGFTGLLKKLPGPTRKVAEDAVSLLPGVEMADVGEAVQEQSGMAAAAVGSVASGTFAFLFQLVMMLIALYFMLGQGKLLLDWIDAASPLRRGQTHELFGEFKKVSRSIVVSTVATAGAQAATALVGYLIARVPSPFFFAAITFVIAFIPSVGGGIVCFLAAGLMLLTGHPYAAIFLAVWSVFAVGLVDNLVHPLVMRGGVQMNGAVVFFALIGGLAAFGAVGLLVGPFAIAFFLALLRIYWRDFAVKPPGGTPAPRTARLA
jgi:predicted PurR-regulated permease PerM